MKTVTYDEFVKFNPCWLETKQGRQRLKRYFAKGNGSLSALDMLKFGRIPAADRLWAVLREELIDAPVLHEFACRCAGRALSRIDNPDPCSIAAIQAKRDWLQGKIDDKQLYAAWDAATDAALFAAWDAAEDAARFAANNAADAATDAALFAVMGTAEDAERQWQVETLIQMLEG